MLAGTVRFRGAVPRPFWLLHKPVLVPGGQGLAGQAWRDSHGAPGGGWEGLAKATQAMNPVPSPALLEGWGLKMESRTPSAPLLRKENRNRGSASTSRK